MSNPTTPGPATTLTGAGLPLVALPQKNLLTVNESDIPLIKDTMRRTGAGCGARRVRTCTCCSSTSTTLGTT